MISIHFCCAQKKTYDEQKSIFGGNMNRDSSYQDLQDMKYLEIFIKESQRLIPAVSLIGRLATDQIQIGIN